MTAEGFDVNAYWLHRGKNYINEERLGDSSFREQERFIAQTVQEFKPQSILEVGCGFGRVTKVLAGTLPDCPIAGLDLSPDQIWNACQYCRNRNVSFGEWDLCQEKPLPAADLVLAVEVLLHHPDDIVDGILRRMLAAGKVILHTFDLCQPNSRTLHVFWHDYDEMYGTLSAKFQRRYVNGHQLIVAHSVSVPELVTT